MKEFTDSISNALKNRLTNPVYGTFLISWVIFHWNFLYALFALDSKEILIMEGVLKNDYLQYKYFNITDLYFWVSWILPFILTYLVIWKFPKWFLIDGYQEEGKYETEKKLVRLGEAERIKEAEAKLQQESAKELKAIAEQKESEVKIKEADPTIEYEKEYQELKNKKIFEHFRTLYEIVYNNDGSVYGQQHYQSSMSLIAYLDSSEALEYRGGSITLNEKGNYFMRRYLEEVS